ncbi:dephospho-CoA kinase [Paraurantiacibacter namhicola]|uniref:Dephospho-CoA kinase n=1 Tax=Paraurantiacibacter namhicola TaxID=645517 RepID=A0A1C7D5L9_9SPHN|nr:dephospho-CoA kinase [Paraurantiacibacter namhicola]ANU06759.1 Dephospho-CoA kinase [Paraurantiacibacter namhicola]
MSRPLVIGLTGSIGMGKSTVAAMFAERGVPVFDADAAVRKLQGPAGALLEPIEAAFPGTTGPDGLDRAAMGALVFDDPEALARLESIVHPAVAERRAAFLLEHGSAPMVLFDIPLLFEKGGADVVDVIVVVSAPAAIQRARVLARPGMTPERFAEILELQLPDVEKRLRADHVIDTGMTLEQTRAAVADLVKKLGSEAAKA